MQMQHTKNLNPREIWIGYNIEFAESVYVLSLHITPSPPHPSAVLNAGGFPLYADFNLIIPLGSLNACLFRCLGGRCVTLRHDCKEDYTIAPWTQ